MNERFLAIGGVLCVLLVAYFMGRFAMIPVRDSIGSRSLRALSSLIIGMGLIGIVTAIAGGVIGYSQSIFKGVYIISILSFVLYLVFKKDKIKQGFGWQIKPYLEFPVVLVLVAAVYHLVCYMMTGFSYIIGSDSFSYIYIAQKYLALGSFAPIPLEPLGEIMPTFKVPCLIEMVYINLLAISNLIAINLFAKMQFIIALSTVFFVAKKMGGWLASWFAIAIFLTEPIIAYFAGESADNYFLSASFLILCIYYLWLFCQSRKSTLLLYSGIFAGMMVSVKLTTCYYLFAFIIAVPILLQKFHFQNKFLGFRFWSRLVMSLYFSIPALVISGIFPLLIYLKTSGHIMGFDWVVTDLTDNNPISWIYPYYKIGYNSFDRYSDIFIKHPDLPYSLAGVLRVLSYYFVNPFRLYFGGSLNVLSHSPVAFFVVAICPFFIALSRKSDYFLKWLACTLLFAYGFKLLNYPLLDPPKSEIFQLLPTVILLSYFISIVKYEWKGKVLDNGWILRIVMVFLLPIIFINTYRIFPQYHGYIKSYSFASMEEISSRFNQKWYIDNLKEGDTLFGRHLNQLCYISKPKVVPFYWEAMHFVPWERIERRIKDLNVNVIYDSSYTPDYVRSRYIKILPIIMKRDRVLYSKIEDYLLMYEKNFSLKEKFLSKNCIEATSDPGGKVYVVK